MKEEIDKRWSKFSTSSTINIGVKLTSILDTLPELKAVVLPDKEVQLRNSAAPKQFSSREGVPGPPSIPPNTLCTIDGPSDNDSLATSLTNTRPSDLCKPAVRTEKCEGLSDISMPAPDESALGKSSTPPATRGTSPSTSRSTQHTSHKPSDNDTRNLPVYFAQHTSDEPSDNDSLVTSQTNSRPSDLCKPAVGTEKCEGLLDISMPAPEKSAPTSSSTPATQQECGEDEGVSLKAGRLPAGGPPLEHRRNADQQADGDRLSDYLRKMTRPAIAIPGKRPTSSGHSRWEVFKALYEETTDSMKAITKQALETALANITVVIERLFPEQLHGEFSKNDYPRHFSFPQPLPWKERILNPLPWKERILNTYYTHRKWRLSPWLHLYIRPQEGPCDILGLRGPPIRQKMPRYGGRGTPHTGSSSGGATSTWGGMSECPCHPVLSLPFAEPPIDYTGFMEANQEEPELLEVKSSTVLFWSRGFPGEFYAGLASGQSILVIGDQATCKNIRGDKRLRMDDSSHFHKLTWAKENPDDFLQNITHALLTAALMSQLGMESVDDVYQGEDSVEDISREDIRTEGMMLCLTCHHYFCIIIPGSSPFVHLEDIASDLDLSTWDFQELDGAWVDEVLQGLDDQNTTKALEDWIAQLTNSIGLFTLLRKSNLVPPSRAAFSADKHLTRDSLKLTPDGLIVRITWSKTRQFRQKVLQLPVAAIPGHPLCPEKNDEFRTREFLTAKLSSREVAAIEGRISQQGAPHLSSPQAVPVGSNPGEMREGRKRQASDRRKQDRRIETSVPTPPDELLARFETDVPLRQYNADDIAKKVGTLTGESPELLIEMTGLPHKEEDTAVRVAHFSITAANEASKGFAPERTKFQH
ncbi:hypothetical protein Bbelb_185860 [Branchiostoma belcheri]|nr:hypothetical protein Bbelb_185860 [Branchiostoma belcheri]